MIIKGEYQFEVLKPGMRDDRFEAMVDSWIVQLPHSCDEWEIAGRSSKDEAVKELESFIKEANEALDTLKKL